jgi:hypothetical protein
MPTIAYMDVNRKDIRVTVNCEESFVNLRWFRGASRYNNGCTRFRRKHALRLALSRSKEHSRKFESGKDAENQPLEKDYQ